jgi:hypothetical protein
MMRGRRGGRGRGGHRSDGGTIVLWVRGLVECMDTTGVKIILNF